MSPCNSEVVPKEHEEYLSAGSKALKFERPVVLIVIFKSSPIRSFKSTHSRARPAKNIDS